VEVSRGYKYLYVNADGRAQFCSQVVGGGKDVGRLTIDDLRAAEVYKACEGGCALGCVRTVSHALGAPLGSLRASLEALVDVLCQRPASRDLPSRPA
jgi:hypothetical protein